MQWRFVVYANIREKKSHIREREKEWEGKKINKLDEKEKEKNCKENGWNEVTATEESKRKA